jgi:aquaporin related protein
MKFGEYEMANPGLDFNDHDTRLFMLPANAVTAERIRRPGVVAKSAAKVVRQVIGGERLQSQVFGEEE